MKLWTSGNSPTYVVLHVKMPVLHFFKSNPNPNPNGKGSKPYHTCFPNPRNTPNFNFSFILWAVPPSITAHARHHVAKPMQIYNNSSSASIGFSHNFTASEPFGFAQIKIILFGIKIIGDCNIVLIKILLMWRDMHYLSVTVPWYNRVVSI